MTIRVLLADDHEFFRSGFRNALETQPDLECVGDVGDGQAAVTEIERLRPDVAVLDVRMPRMDGLTAAETVLSRGTETRIMLLTTYDDDSYVYRGLRAGTSGFCLKSMPVEELLGAIRVVARGDALIDPSVTRRLVTRFANGVQIYFAESAMTLCWLGPPPSLSGSRRSRRRCGPCRPPGSRRTGDRCRRLASPART